MTHLTRSELTKITKFCESCSDSRLKNALKVFLICCDTGFTLSEILSLKFQHLKGKYVCFQAKEGRLVIEKTLNDKLVEIIGVGEPERTIVERVSLRDIVYVLFELRDALTPGKRITLFHARKTYNYQLTFKK